MARCVPVIVGCRGRLPPSTKRSSLSELVRRSGPFDREQLVRVTRERRDGILPVEVPDIQAVRPSLRSRHRCDTVDHHRPAVVCRTRATRRPVPRSYTAMSSKFFCFLGSASRITHTSGEYGWLISLKLALAHVLLNQRSPRPRSSRSNSSPAS